MHPLLYPRILRPAFFRLPAERAHDLAMSLLTRASSNPALLRMLPTPPRSVVGPYACAGLEFPNRIGLAAGFDKNGVALPAWDRLGFGFIELGTVTARAQPGNPRPRIFRYRRQKALINRLGFNNLGADAVVRILARHREAGRWPKAKVGINLGKSKVTPLEEATADYLYSLERLHRFADYLVLNVSSPNTPDLRKLQHGDALGELLFAVQNHGLQQAEPKPVFLKIAPDLSPEELRAITQTAADSRITGLIATNTTLDHRGISGSRDEAGGLSGAPLRNLAEAVLGQLRAMTSLPIMGVGGILNAEDGERRFQAGASLLQVYTGLIYRGPALLHELLVVERLHRE